MRAIKGCLLTIIIFIVNLLIGGYILDSVFGDFQFPTLRGYIYKKITEKPKKHNPDKTKSTTRSKTTKKPVKRKNSAKPTDTIPAKQDTTVVLKDTVLAIPIIPKDTVLTDTILSDTIISKDTSVAD
jgi:hypothetical protein